MSTNKYITREPYLLFDMDGRISRKEWVALADSMVELEKIKESEDRIGYSCSGYAYPPYGKFIHVYGRVVVKWVDAKCLDLAAIIAEQLSARLFDDIESSQYDG